MPKGIGSVDPAKFPGETFELWSIPAFDKGGPEIILGADIGSSKKCVEPNDVLLSRIVPHIRRSWIVKENTQGFRQIASSEWITFRSPRIYSPYLRHVLVSETFHAKFIQTVAGVGGSLLRARPEGVREIEIPLPPLDEQMRIAAILDQADELRRLRQRAIDRLNELGQAIFYEMFGDPATNPMGWPIECADNLCARITVGIVVKPASHYQDSGVPAIRGMNIKPNGIDLSEPVYFSEQANETTLAKTRVWEGDIVIVRSGKPGLAAVVPGELSGINSIDVLIVTPKQSLIKSRFLRDLINSPGGKRIILSESRGQVQQHFNVKSLSETEIFVPPIALQIEYENVLDAVELQHLHLIQAAGEAESLFKSLQHRAFQGKL
jgi:type I restriction enzyme S subunit